MIRRKVPTGAAVVAASEDDESSGRPAVPPDVPMDEQTTNHLSSAYAKKVNDTAATRILYNIDFVAIFNSFRLSRLPP